MRSVMFIWFFPAGMRWRHVQYTRGRLLHVLAAVSLAVTLAACTQKNLGSATKSHLEQGRADYDARRYSDAEREFRHAVQLQRDDPEAHYWLGITLRELGRHDEAMTELYRAHQVRHDYSDSLILLAQLMVRSNDVQYVKWSADHAQRVLQTKSDPGMRAEAYYILGLGRIRLNDVEGATGDFNRALQESPGHVGALCLLALQDADRGQVNAGEQRLKSALVREPNSIALTSALAEYSRMARKPSEAEAEWRRVIALDPANVPARINLIDLLCSLGRDDESEDIAQSLRKQPDSQYWQWHALLLFRKGQFKDAVAELQEIVRSTPRDPTATLRLAAALVAVNRLSEAETLFDQAERSEGRSLGPILMRAQTALTRNDPRMAAQLIAEAMKLDPASGQPHLLTARLPQHADNPFRVSYELGEALRLEATLLPARLTLARRQVAVRDLAAAFGVLDSCPKVECSTFPVLLQKSWVMLAGGHWSQASVEIDGLAAFERSPEIFAQQAILRAAWRSSPVARSNAAELVPTLPNSPIAAEVTKLVDTRSPSLDEITARARSMASQPPWESYGSDLLTLPRGLMRSVLDPEGLIPLQSFGRWEPMINAP